jgi:putative acyl-CoA dehydrogenase
MVAATRLDCVLGSASLMRHALAEASWHVAHRSAFGSLLADKPLMQNVVADLAVESEAGDRARDPAGRGRRPHRRPARGGAPKDRLPLAKFWVCKRTPGFVAEAARVPGRQRLRRGLRACRSSTARRR